MAEELNTAGTVTAQYAEGRDTDEPLATNRGGNLAFYEADGLGSVTSLTNGAGSAVAAYTRDAFGKPISTADSSVNNSFRYTARDYDQETGLYYYRARFYDPAVGRFTAEDLLQFADGRSRYVYVLNSPTSFLDPYGLCPWEVRSRPMRIPRWLQKTMDQLTPPDNPPTHAYFYNHDTGEAAGLGSVNNQIGLIKPVPGQWETNEAPQSTPNDVLVGKVPDKICDCVDNRVKHRGKPPNYCVLGRGHASTPCANCWNWVLQVLQDCSKGK